MKFGEVIPPSTLKIFSMIGPLISIIIPVFNNRNTIEGTLLSVIDQSMDNYELIIVDGGSTDGSLDIIKKYHKWIDLTISESDEGIYDAFNKGVRAANGEWICFIGADDRLYSKEFTHNADRNLKMAIERSNFYVYGKIEHRNEKGGLIEIGGIPWDEAKKCFYQTMNINHCGAFHHKSLFNEFGLFDINFKIAGDYDFLLRIMKAGTNPIFIDEIFVCMLEGGVSNAMGNRLRMVKEVKVARSNNGLEAFVSKLILWEIRVRFMLLINFILGERTSLKLADVYRKFMGKDARWSE